MKTLAEREAVRDELSRIAEKNGGLLTPDAVVAEARKKGSPMHGLFNWNVQEAAYQHWLEQARELIRTVRVVIKTERTTISAVAYVRDPSRPPDEQGYIATASVMGDEERSRAVLVSEFSRAASALRRARELAVAFDLVGEIDAATEMVEVMRTKVDARVEQRPATN